VLRRLFVHRAHWRSDVKTRRLYPVIPLSTDVRFQMWTMGQGGTCQRKRDTWFESLV